MPVNPPTDIQLQINEAEFSLSFELDPHAAGWERVPEPGEGFPAMYKAGDYALRLEEHNAEGHTLVTFTLTRDSGEAFTLRRCVLEARGSSVDLDRVWIPYHLSQWVEAVGLHSFCGDRIGLQWLTREAEMDSERTMANSGIPVILALNRRGTVKLAVGYLDQRFETELHYLANTQNARGPGRGATRYWLERPTKGHVLHDITEHSDGIFVSSGLSWFDTMEELRSAHDRATGRTFRPSPDAAWEPMWVPWGAPEGQWATLPQEALGTRELWDMALVARDLGFGAITNSGSWFVEEDVDMQGDSTGWGYPDTIGDFVPSRQFSDMKAFVHRMRGIGMKWLPWISPWLVGSRTRARKKLEDATIKVDLDPSHPEYNICTSYLCPRHPATQRYVEQLVETLMHDYELDGFCMDMLEFTTTHPCVSDHEHNYDSVGLAMAEGLARVASAVYRANPGALIEFRPRYSNLWNLYHATQHRSADSGQAGAYDMNRRQCVQMRSYIPPGIAVHSDPQWWHIEESNETVAKMLSTIAVCSVPQVGADIINMPEEHRRLIKVWLSFYHEHKESFRTGRMRPVQNDANSSTIVVESGKKAFVSFAAHPAIKVPLNENAEEIYLFNCTNEDWLHTVLLNIEGEFSATVRNYDLSPLSETSLPRASGDLLVELDVPQGGCVAINKT